MNDYLCDDDQLWEALAYGEEKTLTIDVNIFKRHVDRIEICNLLGANFSRVYNDILLIYAINGCFEELKKLKDHDLPDKVFAAYVRYVGKNNLPSNYCLELIDNNISDSCHIRCLIENMDEVINLKPSSIFGKKIGITAARFGNLDVLKELKEMGHLNNKHDIISAAILGRHREVFEFMKDHPKTSHHYAMALYTGDQFFIDACQGDYDRSDILLKYNFPIHTQITDARWAAYAGNTARLINIENNINMYVAYAIIGRQMRVLGFLNDYKLKFTNKHDPNQQYKKYIFVLANEWCQSEWHLMTLALKIGEFRIIKWVLRKIPHARALVSSYDFDYFYKKFRPNFKLNDKTIDFLHDRYGLPNQVCLRYAIFAGNLKRAQRFQHPGINDTDLYLAMRQGNMKMIKWIHSITGKIEKFNYRRADLDETNSVELISWAREHLDFDVNKITHDCVCKGHLNVLKYLNTIVKLNYREKLKIAAIYHHWHMIRWLLQYDEGNSLPS